MRARVLHSPASNMQCILHIPCLLPPREALAASGIVIHAPHLSRLLARAHETRVPDSGNGATLCQAFGIARQQDWPLAPLLAQSAGLSAGAGYWLCATPVHLETRRNALVLSGAPALSLSRAESDALAATLAAHLRAEGVTLHHANAGQWFLQTDATPGLTTTSLDQAQGRDVREFLPQGVDSRRWHRLLTEMQMLLHAHPLNDARDAAAQLPLNSVWLWGGGTLPAAPTATVTAVWSDDEAVRAVAHHAGRQIAPAPARITPDMLDAGTHFFSSHVLAAPLRQNDLPAWSAALAALDRDWFQPLLAALRSRQLKHLRLHTGDGDSACQFDIAPRYLYKFWRKNKYL